jgi:hypothetical protein
MLQEECKSGDQLMRQRHVLCTDIPVVVGFFFFFFSDWL